VSDIEHVVAILATEYGVLTPARALELATLARTNPAAAQDALFGEVNESVLLTAIGQELGFEYVSLTSSRSNLRTSTEVLSRADPAHLRRYSALPQIDTASNVVVVLANPTDPDIRDYLTRIYPGYTAVLGSNGQIQSRLTLSDNSVVDEAPNTVTDTSAEPPSPAQPNQLVLWVDRLLESSVAQNASDLHFEFTDSGLLMTRFRIDGVLHLQPAPQRGREQEVIGILMNKAGMDAANKRQPADGAFSFNALGRKIDVRAAMLPQANGPSIVLRLLDSMSVRRRPVDMGFSPSQLEELLQAVYQPQGTIIIAGPTGSGKTTTLYALIREVASVEKNTITIEDPVEYRLPYVNQTRVTHSSDGRAMGFSDALRAIMRMDPDIILVGEIRDAETAKTAMDAAITGHLVLSTVHTRDAVGIYTRLVEMGVPSYMVADAMTLGVSQRLARRVHNCATMGPPTDIERATFEHHNVPVPDLLPHPVGCDGCAQSGYQGRVAVVEVLHPTKTFRALVIAEAGQDALTTQALLDGFIPMTKEGLRLVQEGLTTVAEILRVVES
jgi:type IV pilus assembly protein PilB